MPSRKVPQDEQHIYHHAENVWWLRILEKQGFATLFGCVVLWGGWRLGDAHMDFLNQQIAQMSLQTSILREIARSNQEQEEALQRLQGELRDSNNGHGLILEEIRKAKIQ